MGHKEDIMKIDKLRLLAHNYVENFYTINDEEHDENMKWKAVQCFQDNFTFDCDNFSEMLKASFAECSILLDNAFVCPTHGMIQLAKYDEVATKELFMDLFADDGGDINVRQTRIVKFVDDANALLEKYAAGKWKYRQEFRSALFYLVFYKPGENYFYKASQSQPLLRYLEFGTELGSGKSFSLSEYYRQCDVVRNAISEDEELISMNKNRYNDSQRDVGDDLRILVFDLMYSGQVYGFYQYCDYSKAPSSKSSSKSKKDRQAQEFKEKTQELETLQNQLNNLLVEMDNIPDINLDGLTVSHRRFGEGVVSQNESYLNVKFEERESVFALPGALADGFLSVGNHELVGLAVKQGNSINQAKNLSNKIRTLEGYLSNLNY